MRARAAENEELRLLREQLASSSRHAEDTMLASQREQSGRMEKMLASQREQSGRLEQLAGRLAEVEKMDGGHEAPRKRSRSSLDRGAEAEDKLMLEVMSRQLGMCAWLRRVRPA